MRVTTHHPPRPAATPTAPSSIRDAVAYELVLTALAPTLLRRDDVPLRVLELGGGDGRLAAALADRGHRITVLAPDVAAADVVRERLRREDAASGVVELMVGAGEDAPALVGAGFDLTCCHDVLPYVADPAALLRAISAVTGPGATVSLTGVNAAGLAMRPATLRSWPQVLRALDPEHDGMRFFVPGAGAEPAVRADHLPLVESALAGVGVEVTQWYGHRVFTDVWADSVDAVDKQEWEQMVEAEWQAARSPHYRAVAPYWHVLGRRSHDDAFAPTLLGRRR